MKTKLRCLVVKLVESICNLLFSPANVVIYSLIARHPVPRFCQVFTRLLSDYIYHTSICSDILLTGCPLIVSVTAKITIC